MVELPGEEQVGVIALGDVRVLILENTWRAKLDAKTSRAAHEDQGRVPVSG